MVNQVKIPKEYRKIVDEMKSELVERIFERAEELQKELKKFKDFSFKEIKAYMDTLGEEYKIEYKGKGNLALTNNENNLKVIKAVHEFIVFDEKLQIAKELIDKCIEKWSEGSRDEIKMLVKSAFEVNKQGKINIGGVLGLRKINIDDPDWKQAMQAIADSVTTTSSKEYIRLYRRDDEYSKWKQFSLDLATIGE